MRPRIPRQITQVILPLPPHIRPRLRIRLVLPARNPRAAARRIGPAQGTVVLARHGALQPPGSVTDLDVRGLPVGCRGRLLR